MRLVTRLLTSIVTVAIAMAVPTSGAEAGDGAWGWPLADGRVGGPDGRFDRPDSPYAAGHRGIDLPGLVGADVLAVAPGVVTFAGDVAGVGVVTVDHGGERSTYQPVSPQVDKGDRVETGDVLGELRAGPAHCATACLHLGRLRLGGSRGDEKTYLDPLDRLPVGSDVRLVDPDGEPPVPPVWPSGSGILRTPVGGPITSPFGGRDHPVTGEHKLHDGIDFGAACGTLVKAAAPGVVTKTGPASGYGRRVVVRHTDGLTTLYGHLSSIDVRPGDDVSPSTTLGRVGSTGLSTGCHLHFGVFVGGNAVDPGGFL